ncbi:uncharacterized protein LOC134272932 [Saccostrea cucullata]|uniref:uncharacterized protein LOC134272932 n=1 Tax=Saccostrea cuccullata TaxID=36930 RepID=UPI002ED48531
MEAFDKMTKKQLIDFLKKCKQPNFGNKLELIQRAKGAKDLGLDVDHDDVDSGDQHAQDKIITPLEEGIPVPSKLTEGWVTNCEYFPDITENEIYNYLVLSKRTFDLNQQSARRQLKAKIFYDEGHVQNIEINLVTKDSLHCIIKCDCLPSIPTKDKSKKPAYRSWVCLSKVTGRVHTAECNCVAGEGGACNHIAALLYGIVDISVKKHTGKIAPTSKACEWIKPRSRNLSPKKAQDMDFSKTTGKNKSSSYSVIEKNPDLTLPSVQVFKENLAKINPMAGWLKTFSTTRIETLPPTAESIPELHHITFFYMDNVDLFSDECKQQFMQYFGSLQVSAKECEIINKMTKGQHINPMWREARHGRLTASDFGKIVRRKPETLPDNLLKYILGYCPSFSNKAMEWGREHEKVAIDCYLLKVREIHPPLTFQETGLVVREWLPHLGASPDGLVYCSHYKPYHGVIEVKCPYSFKDVHPKEAALSNNFFCILDENGNLQLKRNHAYYYQVQGVMAISQRKWCHFIIWTNKGLEFEKILFDEELWENEILPKLNSFYCSAVLPELFSDRVKRGLKLKF